MSEPHLKMFFAQLVAALLVPIAWLVVCRLIRGLRRRIRFCYAVAGLLSLVTCLVIAGGMTATALIAGVIVIAILYLLYKRALRRRSFAMNTIISYENR